MAQNKLFDSPSFTLRERAKPVSIDSLPKGEELKEAKKRYAEFIHKQPKEYFKAAVEAVGERLAGYVWNTWIDDLDVTEYIKTLKAVEESDDAVLGTKVELCRKLMDIAEKHTNSNPKDAIHALTLVAEIRGFKQKPADVQVTNQQVVNKVMIVKSFGNEDEWEAQALKQQSNLTNSTKVIDVEPN